MLSLGIGFWTGHVAAMGGGAGVTGTIWNAADIHADLQISGAGLTLTETAHTSGTGSSSGRGTTTKASGYFEVQVTNVGNPVIGLDDGASSLTNYVGQTGTSMGWQGNGNVLNNFGVPTTYSTFATNDWLGIAFKAGKVYFGKWNGSSMVWQGGSDPSAGTGGITPASAIASAYPMASMSAIGDAFLANFIGPFLGTIPTGLAAWG